MNSKTKDVRQMLFNLRKKYCVDIAKKYSKKISSSSDDLSSDEDLDPSISKSSIEKVSTPKRESPVKDIHGSAVTITSDIEYKPKPSESSSVKSLESVSSVKSVVRQQIVPSESSISSVRTDIDGVEDSDVEEDLSEASDSSVPNVLANVHLISDDILEDADTNVSSDRSNFDYEGRSSGGRLSVVHSIKSIQLGSPIEPPDLEHMEYESDFESSDNSSEFENSLPLKTVATGVKVTKPNDRQPSLKMNEYILNKSDGDSQNSSSTKSHVESILKTELVGNILYYSDGTEDINKEKSLEKAVSGDMISENDIEERASSRYTSLSNYRSSHERDTSNDDKEYKNQYSFQNKPNSKIIIDHGNFVNQNTNADIKIPTEDGGKGSCSSLTIGINSGSSSSRKCTEEKLINSEDEVCKKQDTVVENNGNGIGLDKIKSNFISVGVQTSQTESVPLQNKFFEQRDIQHKKRQKVFYVNTSVKSTKCRPVVEAGKFSLTDTEASGYNPYSFPDQVTEGMTVEELINKILRNQITMTKHFMDCHHSLYVQCCQVVQSMNQEYKNNKICFITP